MTMLGKPDLSIGPLDRIPPHDLAAEAGVLGSLIIDPDTIDPVCSFLKTPHAFFREENQIVFGTILELTKKGVPIDAMILHSTLKTNGMLTNAGGIENIRDLANSVPTSAHAEYYAAIVQEKFMRRQGITAANQSLRDLYESAEPSSVVLDRAEQRLFSLVEQKIASDAESVSSLIGPVIESIFANPGDGSVKTGLLELDNLTNGLHPGEMIVLAARPSHGKTALGLNIAENAAMDKGVPVGFFSLEMSKSELSKRLLCSRAGVDGHKMRMGHLNPQERERVGRAAGEIEATATTLFIDDTPGLSAMEFRAKARRMVRKHGVRLIILDYLQLMEAEGEKREVQVSAISRMVKAAARELNIPIIALSQLNRLSETQDRVPRPSDLRESGAIEQDADAVWLLYREAVAKRGDEQWFRDNPEKVNLAMLIIAKQRNGPCDTIRLTYLSGATRFVNLYTGEV
jgi:replicative DNA helicase